MVLGLISKAAYSFFSKGEPEILWSPFLNQLSLEKGLARRAINYVRSGADRPVLSALGSLKSVSQQRNMLNARGYCRHFRDEPEQLARYVEVVCTALDWSPSRSSYNKQVTDETPDAVAQLFYCFASSLNYKSGHEAQALAAETSFDDLLGATECLGGRPADLINHVVPCGYNHETFKVQGQEVDRLIQGLEVNEYIEALKRRSASDRANVLTVLKTYPVSKDPAFLDYLLECAASKSSKVQEVAVEVLRMQNHDAVLNGVKPLLFEGTAATRASAARVIGWIGTVGAQSEQCIEKAMEMLRAQEAVEKSQNVLVIIKHFTVSSGLRSSDALEGRYEVIDKSFIEIPTFTKLADNDDAPFGPDELAALNALDDQKYAQQLEYYTQQMERFKTGDKMVRRKPEIPTKRALANDVFAMLNSKAETTNIKRFNFYRTRHLMPMLSEMITRVSDARLVMLAVQESDTLSEMFGYQYGLVNEELMRRVQDGDIDVRQIIAAAEERELPVGRKRANQQRSKSSERNLLLEVLNDHYFNDYSARMAEYWPITATYLADVLSGLPPHVTDSRVNQNALGLLSDLPKLPVAAVEGVLFAALDERPKISALAQALLQGAEGIDERVIEALKDKRQGVRASAARFLADRGAVVAITPLVTRLQTEKSESARAKMISAISRLGGDTTPYLSRDSMTKEAQALVRKLPNTKLDWLNIENAPALKWPDGSAVDPVIPDAWLRLAVKLKDPSEALLFNLYFDQIAPAEVVTFSQWVLNSWTAYDTWRPSIDEERKIALEQAKQSMAGYPQQLKYTSEEQLAANFLRDLRNTYSNSGSDTKGILALTHRAPAAKATATIAAYLKKHGKRVSQAKTLVDVLYAMETPEALQVLVATATRFKQRTVRELAEQRVAEIAEQRGWSQDELADRSVPTGGIDEDGVLGLEVGEEAKLYSARLGSDLSVKLFNASGKEVKAIPASTDANTKEAKALLSAAKKTVKAAVSQQSIRLYDGMVAARQWPLDAWERDFVAHPIMTRLIERVIWRGLTKDGRFVTGFRPTAEGDRLTADGDDADLSDVAFVDIAHTTTLDQVQRNAWIEHLDDFEVSLLFPQITRPVIALGDDRKKLTSLEDRKGWLMDTFTLRGKAIAAGFARGEIVDSGSFYEYVKSFRSAGIQVSLEFTGSYVPEENLPAAIVEMRFYKMGCRRNTDLELGKVPPMVLSEAWNDLHEIASKGAFDKDWERKGLY